MNAPLRWDLLPRFMQVRKKPEFMGGQLYSLSKSIRILDREASESVVSEVLGRLPAANATEIAWEQVPHDEIVSDDAPDACIVDRLRVFLDPYSRRGDPALVLWSAVLCVELSTAHLAEHLEELVDSTAEFSIYLPNAMTLIDRQFSGRVVVAGIEEYV
ncbi:hypothetical protein K3N28_20945 [Glycomyces sp. TRM65418]|uniref:hypothetical protein n=1 Tax=Glycomyces sp. TRM65418 TaxID=2867006 RepID=UPI001CE5F3BE|nr:hypothetical protein [Glycomyces sp. TRM65418]MCC3765533.1 hypothetical protein [Glycomyces sp. TRM65418]QZD55140.1 hypothetical protein K3N28_20840 [Glycomyces sp. TRM65418]